MSHDSLATLVRRPCEDRSMAVWSSWTFKISFIKRVQLFIFNWDCTSKTKKQHRTETPADSKKFQIIWRPHDHRGVAVRLPHDDCSISVPFYGHCTGIVRRLCDSRAGGPTIIARAYGHRATFLSKNDQQKPCVLRTIAVRPPCDARTGIVRCSYDVSSGFVSTILIFLYNSELNKIVEATTTLRRPKNVRCRTISVRRSYENGNLGIVRSP